MENFTYDATFWYIYFIVRSLLSKTYSLTTLLEILRLFCTNPLLYPLRARLYTYAKHTIYVYVYLDMYTCMYLCRSLGVNGHVHMYYMYVTRCVRVSLDTGTMRYDGIKPYEPLVERNLNS